MQNIRAKSEIRSSFHCATAETAAPAAVVVVGGGAAVPSAIAKRF